VGFALSGCCFLRGNPDAAPVRYPGLAYLSLVYPGLVYSGVVYPDRAYYGFAYSIQAYQHHACPGLAAGYRPSYNNVVA